ncbi:MAG: hypothetical protein U0414_06325 [Polyangiaceae bacterium]
MGLAFLAGAVGCSPDTADLFKTGATGSGGAGGSGATTSTKAVTSTSTSPPDTTSVTTTGSTNPDTTSVTTTSGPMETVGSPASSGSGNPGGDTVPCGGAGNCATDNGGVCCWNFQTKTSACTVVDDCQFGNDVYPTAISCHLPSDCGFGEVCCAHKYFGDPSNWYDSTTCEFDCGNPDRPVCDPQAPVNVCPTYQDQTGLHQMVCKQSSYLPMGYSTCQLPN